MRVICINDKGRPAEIPSNKWVEKGREYTVLNTVKCNAQGGRFAYILKEIDLSPYAPYIGFAANRFGIPKDEPKEELEEKLYSYG